MLLTIGVVVAAVLVRYALLQQLCTVTLAVCEQQGQVTPEGVENLQRVGLSLGFYATNTTVLTFAPLLVSWTVAAIIFWRRSDHWMALLVMLLLISLHDGGHVFAVAGMYPSWWLPIAAVQFFGAASLVLFYKILAESPPLQRWDECRL